MLQIQKFIFAEIKNFKSKKVRQKMKEVPDTENIYFHFMSGHPEW